MTVAVWMLLKQQIRWSFFPFPLRGKGDFFVILVTHLFETTLAEETEGFVNSFFGVFWGQLDPAQLIGSYTGPCPLHRIL